MNGNGFTGLLREGIIAQGLIGTVIWGAIVWQIANNQPVSDALLAAGSIILGYYFRSEVQSSKERQVS